MDDQIEKYFIGDLSKEEKRRLFHRIDQDPVLKSEFVEQYNSQAYLNVLLTDEDEAKISPKWEALQHRILVKRMYHLGWVITKYAAIVILLLVNGWLLKDHFFEQPLVPKYTTIQVPCGQRIYLTLQDGTEVWLNSRSVLRIPNVFQGDERVVELDGEGFFAVTKDVEHPFRVKTPIYDVKVLGTKFNVFSYSENHSFEASLVEGKVQVVNPLKTEETCTLNPDEKVVLRDGTLLKSNEVFENVSYLDSGIYYFNNKRFAEILDCLQVWYDVEFEVSPTVKTHSIISGKFRQNDEIDRVLKALQGVLQFHYQVEENSKRIRIENK